MRRVYDRFGQTYGQYEGLYWSHFQSAVDWDDAEMWLEGAVQNGWSISVMRRSRWQTRGAVESEKPNDEEVIANESDVDEDCDPKNDGQIDRTISGSTDYADSVVPEGPDFGDEDESSRSGSGAAVYSDDTADTLPLVRPFENLAELPDDLGEAFESFKLAILRHKASDWDQISRDDVLASLDALKELALAPSAEDSGSPF